MLKEMEALFSAFEIDFYLVGALARDIQLSSNPALASIRKTEDVDLAIMIANEKQFYKLKSALIATGNFKAHDRETIKLFYKEAIEIDLLPFGGIESESREIRLTEPKISVLNMPGFKEIYPSVNDIEITSELKVKVCDLEGIILLKLIANDDRPERTKDISDIEHIITVYFDLRGEQIYDDHFDLMQIYSIDNREYLQLVAARVIGRKINNFLLESQLLKERLQLILSKRPTNLWKAMLEGLNDNC